MGEGFTMKTTKVLNVLDIDEANFRYLFYKLKRSYSGDNPNNFGTHDVVCLFNEWEIEIVVNYKIYVFNRLVREAAKFGNKVINLDRYALITYVGEYFDNSTKRFMNMVEKEGYAIDKSYEDVYYGKNIIHEAKYIKNDV
jgi:hypothetical protein